MHFVHQKKALASNAPCGGVIRGGGSRRRRAFARSRDIGVVTACRHTADVKLRGAVAAAIGVHATHAETAYRPARRRPTNDANAVPPLALNAQFYGLPSWPRHSLKYSVAEIQKKAIGRQPTL